MGGKTGRLFIEFGVVLSSAVIFSSFIALTLTPMLCSKFMTSHNQNKMEPKIIEKFRTFYSGTLKISQGNVKRVYIFSAIAVSK